MRKRKPSKPRKPLEVVGWKPKPKWIVSLRKGSGTKTEGGEFNRMTRFCDSLEDGRKIAESYFKTGWDEAWISEKR